MADYYLCPGCGDEVKVGSKGCPKCNRLDPWEIEGNDIYDGLDLPDDDFDYDEFVDREFGKSVSTNRLKFVWWISAVILLIALIFAWVLN